jgi:hypothetical protein
MKSTSSAARSGTKVVPILSTPTESESRQNQLLGVFREINGRPTKNIMGPTAAKINSVVISRAPMGLQPQRNAVSEAPEQECDHE